MKKREGIEKKTIIRNYVRGFFLASIATIGIILAFSKEVPWGYLLLGVGYWAFFCGVLGVATYFYHKSHPKLSKTMNEPEIKKGFSMINIYLGSLLIVVGIYNLIKANIGVEKEVFLVLIVFGLLTLLWGISDYIREKRNKTK
jgi:zinc transporter ZupT